MNISCTMLLHAAIDPLTIGNECSVLRQAGWLHQKSLTLVHCKNSTSLRRPLQKLGMSTCDIIEQSLVQHVLPHTSASAIEEQPAQPSQAVTQQTDTSIVVAILASGVTRECHFWNLVLAKKTVVIKSIICVYCQFVDLI